MAQQRKNINPEGTEEFSQRFQFSQGVQVGNLLHISGQVGMDAAGKVLDGIEAQAQQAFQNLRRVIEKAGGTTDDLVDIISFHTSMDMKDLEVIARVKADIFPNNAPAWTAIGIKELAFPGLMLEVRGTAILKE
jgi:enamine deaminase RidA (YjgF/YER057c/UK114 family)